ncbi:hypothetical protein [Mycolicibacterium sp. XJ870]
MSWLLVALIPGLLMLATFGLDRLEAGLTRERPVTKARSWPRIPTMSYESARVDGPDSLDDLQRRLRERHLAVETLAGGIESERLPTRCYDQHGINPEFQPTRHANRV